MFGGLGKTMKNLGKFQKLMKDDNFKSFLNNEDVKKMMQDPQFQEAVKTKNYMKLMSNPKLLEVMQKPEIQEMISKLDVKDFKM